MEAFGRHLGRVDASTLPFLLPVHYFGKFAFDRGRADEGLGQARSVRESADCKLRDLAFQFLFGEGDLSQLENLSNALARRSCCGLDTRC